MDQETYLQLTDYIRSNLGHPNFDESKLDLVASLETLLENLILGKLDVENFYLLEGTYKFYPPETFKVEFDENNRIISVDNPLNENAYISNFVGSKWGSVNISSEVVRYHPYIVIPTSSFKSEITRSPLLASNLLLGYDSDISSKLILLGIQGVDYLREGEHRVMVPDLKPN